MVIGAGDGANLEEKFKDKASLGASFKNGPPGFARRPSIDTIDRSTDPIDRFDRFDNFSFVRKFLKR